MHLNRMPSYSLSLRTILAIYSIGFLVGTSTHISHILTHGIFKHSAPITISIYWDALALLDPFTTAVLWWQPKLGIALALGIMVSDISINTYYYLAGYSGPATPGMVPLFLFDQALFGLFVFVTAPMAYQQVRQLRAKTA